MVAKLEALVSRVAACRLILRRAYLSRLQLIFVLASCRWFVLGAPLTTG